MSQKYKAFTQSTLLTDWNTLLKMSREEVVKIQESWEEIHRENKELSLEQKISNSKKVKAVVDILESLELDVHKYKTQRGIRVKNGYQAWFQNNVVKDIEKSSPEYTRSIPSVHRHEEVVNGIPLKVDKSLNLIQLYDYLATTYKKEKERADKSNKLLIKSVEYAKEHGINIDNLSTEAIIHVVQDAAVDHYLEENVPDGSEIELKHECYDCSTFIVGDYRCSCGNRRIGITVEGNVLEGFYHYPEAY